MSLKSTYQRFTALFLLAAMLWNITGWLGMGLMNAHLLEHSGGEHCEVAFCYCEIEDGNKICTCHHPELHAKEHTENHDFKAMNTSHTNMSSHCYYSKTHNSPTQPDAVIMVSDFHTTLPYLEEQNQFSVVADSLADYTLPLTQGFEPGLLRPPSA